jgi:ABC-type uncharacterized transport system YnjBCD substrate-binding protein
MFKRLTIISLCFIAFACRKDTAPAEEAVAKVNGEAVGKKAFDAAVERNMARYKGQAKQLPPGIEVRIRQSVLRRLIDN